jgi:hypothetical protein
VPGQQGGGGDDAVAAQFTGQEPGQGGQECPVGPGGMGWAELPFVKGQRKDDVMHEHLAGFTAEEGVLFIGRAQEKTRVFRTERRRDAHGDSYPWIVRTTGVVNQFYVYAVDRDFGPFFLKFNSYFPYNAKLCLNGHEWAKRQTAKAGIGHTALDNGFATITDPADVERVQAICVYTQERPVAAPASSHVDERRRRLLGGQRILTGPTPGAAPAGGRAD